MRKIILFNRFLIRFTYSPNELWWTDIKDGSRQYHLFDISLVERSIEEGTYKAFQIIFLNLMICAGDCKSIKRFPRVEE